MNFPGSRIHESQNGKMLCPSMHKWMEDAVLMHFARWQTWKSLCYGKECLSLQKTVGYRITLLGNFWFPKVGTEWWWINGTWCRWQMIKKHSKIDYFHNYTILWIRSNYWSTSNFSRDQWQFNRKRSNKDLRCFPNSNEDQLKQKNAGLHQLNLHILIPRRKKNQHFLPLWAHFLSSSQLFALLFLTQTVSLRKERWMWLFKHLSKDTIIYSKVLWNPWQITTLH